MPVSREMRRLQSKWAANDGWPQRLEWLEIEGIRGWGTGHRIEFKFPIMAVVGENGVGKSTVLQAIVSAYAAPDYSDSRFASDFFPDTTWDGIATATIRASVRQGGTSEITSVRKPGDRWRGNPERKRRHVSFVDLRRVQPVAARVGYARLAKSTLVEATSEDYDATVVQRMTSIMGRTYDGLRLATTNIDATRKIPIFARSDASYSGFHGGAGEVASAELLAEPIKKYSIVLIDEIETSLHPRTQRRLIRDLATVARVSECQIVVTTHSPYILDELPTEGRVFVMDGADGKTLIPGVSVEFAMTHMDDESHPDCEVYVEDEVAKIFLQEMLAPHARDLIRRIRIIAFGPANVGRALGEMVAGKRFPRKSLVFLDGDQAAATGCLVFPGDGDPPERLVFGELKQRAWGSFPTKLVGRGPSEIIDACNQAMTLSNHHDWLELVADRLTMGTDVVWTAMCATWVAECLEPTQAQQVAQWVRDAVDRI